MKGIRYHGWKKKEEYDSYIYIHRNRAVESERRCEMLEGGEKEKRIHARLSSFIERRQTRSLVNYPCVTLPIFIRGLVARPFKTRRMESSKASCLWEEGSVFDSSPGHSASSARAGVYRC